MLELFFKKKKKKKRDSKAGEWWRMHTRKKLYRLGFILCETKYTFFFFFFFFKAVNKTYNIFKWSTMVASILLFLITKIPERT